MDLKFVFVLIAAFYCGECVKGSTIEISGNVTAVMSHQAVLTCKYTSPNLKDFVFIRWKKYVSDKRAVAIATRRGSDKEHFMDTVPKDFQKHTRLQSVKSNNSYSLDLVIDGLECEDIGKYECQAFGMSDPELLTETTYVGIKVHPGTPAFKSDEIQVSLNASFELRCEADVGNPPQPISFSFKAPGSNVYTLVKEGVEHSVEADPARCNNKGVSSLAVTMTEDMDNAHYMCSMLEGNLGPKGEPVNFDEIVLKLYRETTTVKTTQPPSTTPKESEVSDSSAITSTSSCLGLLCGLLLAILLTDRRTDS